jgi:glycosyltransferase involved in cell wall biosynthesis
VRVLLIAFYFPPAGGGGVQRTLKFCRYLPEFGVDVDVLAPSDPKWFARDEPLMKAIPAETTVHRARFIGPASTSKNDAAAHQEGWRRAAAQARYAGSRALIPDKTLPWAATAVPAGIKIVRDRKIDAILTTSPTNSTHLIGEAISTATRRPWIADFRDPWLSHPHRAYERAGVRAKRSVERHMARSVIRRADAVTAVTDAIAAEAHELDPTSRRRTTVIPNGSDFDDFADLSYEPGERMVITHAGAFFGRRSPRPVLGAVKELLTRRPELREKLLLRFVGDLRDTDREWAQTLGIDGAWEETGFLPYAEALEAQRAADALLLLIPDADGRGDVVVSGKVFEYLAAGRPILAAVPPNGVAADLIRRTGAGEVVDGEDDEALEATIERLYDRWAADGLPDVELPAAEREALSRRTRSRELADVIHRVTA